MIIESLQPLAVGIDSIKPDPRNARKHSERNLAEIKKSLKEFGQRKPIVVNSKTMEIEAGNGMWVAAKSLGWDKIAAVITDDPPEVAKAYGIMDNRSAELAEWDMPTLKDLLEELDTGDIDVELSGFNHKEIEDLMTQFHVLEEGLTDDDEIPEDVESVCQPGDLWLMGEHRLLCGDATVITQVEKLMDGKNADLILTDPPYGIDIVKVKNHDISADGGAKPYGKGKVGFAEPVKANLYRPVIGDNQPFDPSLILTLSKNQIIFGANYFASKLPDGNAWIVWDKDVTGTFSEVELAWTSFKGKLRLYHHMWSGLRREGDRKEELTKRVHPTQKPVGLFVAILQDYKGDLIFDPYLGSGSTLIACEKLGRKCYGMEIDPMYCSVIIKRWENFTGRKATLSELEK